jgi:hypothetical protein
VNYTTSYPFSSCATNVTRYVWGQDISGTLQGDWGRKGDWGRIYTLDISFLQIMEIISLQNRNLPVVFPFHPS